DGQTCAGNTDCTNMHCLPPVGGGSNVCCATACSDQGAASCGNTGQCLASGSACAKYPNTTVCAAASCLDGASSSSATAAKTCDGAGSCSVGGGATPCGQFKCGGTTCKAACTPATEVADCITADYCSTTACVAKGAAG